MSNSNNSLTNSQSLVITKENLDYITLTHNDEYATSIKFQVMNPSVRAGDVLVILDGTDVVFHGLIGRIEDGWGVAADPNGSQLKNTLNN